MHKNFSTWHLLAGWVGFTNFICYSVYELYKVPSSELMDVLLFEFEFSGIVLCLVFNVIAVTVCWIKGGGELLHCNKLILF